SMVFRYRKCLGSPCASGRCPADSKQGKAGTVAPIADPSHRMLLPPALPSREAKMPEQQNQIGSIRVKKARWNLPAPVLFEEAVRRGEGRIAPGGALLVTTGKHTGRAANDKFIVKNAASEKSVWWGKVNKPFPQEKFDGVFEKIKRWLEDKE